MSVLVVLLVLLAALLHATWNAIAKFIPDRLAASALIGSAYLVSGVVGCVLLPAPDPASWPYLIVSAIVQTLYLILLTAAYQHGEFASAYPLARGLAVLGVSVVSVTLLGERLTVVQTGGVLVMIVALLSLVGVRRGSGRAGVLLATATGLAIAAYTIVDGVGVRHSGAPLGYASWLFLLQGIGIPAVCVLLSRDRPALGRSMRAHAALGLAGGVLSLVAYAIVVWAQSVAPLALVSALRETSVLMAGLIGFALFREPFSRARTAATIGAVLGIVAMQLGAA